MRKERGCWGREGRIDGEEKGEESWMLLRVVKGG